MDARDEGAPALELELDWDEEDEEPTRPYAYTALEMSLARIADEARKG